MKLTETLKKLFRRQQSRVAAASSTVPPPQATGNAMQKMLEMVGQTQESELSCDEVHALLDQFAEMIAHGEDTTSAMPLVKHHLDTCPDCREEFDALMRILEHAG